MFEGEKTSVFWVGLIIFGFASVYLFDFLWMITDLNGYDPFRMLKRSVPLIVAAIVFILIGLYMMKSGVKPKKKVKPKSPWNVCEFDDWKKCKATLLKRCCHFLSIFFVCSSNWSILSHNISVIRSSTQTQ